MSDGRAQALASVRALNERHRPRREPEAGASFALDAPDRVPAWWGDEHGQVLAAKGEPLLICAPAGLGKTTLSQQLILSRIGIGPSELLGLPVAVDTRPVLYIAADRPAQAARSMRRMVAEKDREALDAGLRVWRGPLPFTVTDDPGRLAAWVHEWGVGTVVIDSLKDIAVGLAEDAIGAAVNQAVQHVIASGVEVVALHHQRKGQDGRKPRALDDVYGSTWITAGAGSVVLLWGEPGDPYVELIHLKQPADEVGPLTVYHDHDRGRSSLPEAVDLLELASRGTTVPEAAQAIYATSTPSRNQREKVRRRLEKLADSGQVERDHGNGPPDPVTYRVHPRALPRASRTDDARGLHEPALDQCTDPCTPMHAPGNASPPLPFKGGVHGRVHPASDDLEAEIDRLHVKHADLAIPTTETT